MGEFLASKLKLKVNEDKSNIYKSGDRGIKFLGFYLRYLPNKLVEGTTSEGTPQLKRVSINQVQLRVPVERVLARLVDKGYAKIRKNGTYRATSNRKLSSLDDCLIVNRISSVIRGILKYYQPANQYSDL